MANGINSSRLRAMICSDLIFNSRGSFLSSFNTVDFPERLILVMILIWDLPMNGMIASIYHWSRIIFYGYTYKNTIYYKVFMVMSIKTF